VLGFNDLLTHSGLDSRKVALIFHTTRLAKLRRMLPWIVAERPDLFDAYQSVHNAVATSTLRKRAYAASFVRVESGHAVLAGVYRVENFAEKTTRLIYADSRFGELARDFGATDTDPAVNIARADRQVQFDLRLTDHLRDLRGRIHIPAATTQTYVRLAENYHGPIQEISAQPVWAAAAPGWRDFVVSGPEVRSLPAPWLARLREWRGIYLIVDESDGLRYVGSAYGEGNLLGRWAAHVARDAGVTKHLGQRNPAQFRFSILERVSPDMPADEVIALEHTWMNRLHTRQFGLNA